MQRDEFEHRMSKGLKRWAEHGKPTLDLEAFVTEKAGSTQAPVKPKRRFGRWLFGPAAAAAALLAAVITFPAWAGAAASWPLVGPVVTEIILKDAGLAWAYEMDLIGQSPIEVREGDITFRVLGVMADSRRTTVIYQFTGVPRQGAEDGKPVRASRGLFGPPPPRQPAEVTISKVNGVGGMSSANPPKETPVGLVGTVSTMPIENPTAELTLAVRVGEKVFEVKVPASRAGTDRFSREVAVNQSKEIDGVTVTVEAVIFTPAETVVRYQVKAPWFYGAIQWNPETDSKHLVVDGKRVEQVSGSGGVNGLMFASFPPVSGRLQFIVPVEAKGVPIEAQWDLKPGATSQVGGQTITLTEVEREGNAIALAWETQKTDSYLGITGYEIVDSAGNARSLMRQNQSMSNYEHQGKRIYRFATELPPGVDPVAIRATSLGVKVTGPWIFDLPR